METEDWEFTEKLVAQTTPIGRILDNLAEDLGLNPGSATYYLWDFWKSLYPSKLNFFFCQLRQYLQCGMAVSLQNITHTHMSTHTHAQTNL